MRPLTLDHVALWVADREPIADFVTSHLGMHVIEQTDKFTLLGSNARRGKLTLFAAEGPRERGAIKHVALRVSDLESARAALPDGSGDEVELGEVGGAYLEFHEGDPGEPEKPLLNHLAVLVDSADDHTAEAEDLGIVESV